MESMKLMLALLTPDERSELRGVLLLATIAALLEMGAVLSVLPFMVLVSDPLAALDHPVALWMNQAFGIWRARDLLLLGGAGVLCLVVAANAVSTLSLRRVQMAAWNINHFLSVRVLGGYLARPYSWFLSRHSAELNRNLLEEVRLIIQGVLIPLLYAAVRGVGALFLVLLLLVVDPGLTLVAGSVLGVAYTIIYFAVRRLQHWLGEMRVGATRVRFQVATEALGGIKEIKALGAETEFLGRFEGTGEPFVRSSAWSLVIAELPRHVLEVLSVGTVLAILLFLLITGRSLDEAVPVLALFAFAGYKLVPAFHQVFSGVTTASFYLPSLREMEAELQAGILPSPRDRESLERGPIHLTRSLALCELSFRYENADRPALSRVDLEIQKGERLGIVGPTGCGKTTLVDVLLGLLEPESGAVLIDGRALESSDLPEWRRSVGYVPQSIFLVDDTIAGNIAFGVASDSADRARVEEVARAASLDAFLVGLPDGLDTEVGERGVRLSGGQRQRIGIARALYRNPDLLLLDEATSALDSRTESEVMKAIFELDRERTLVIIAHRLSTLRGCDRIVVMEKGKVAAIGSWEELERESDIFRVLARRDGTI